jgi:hypothetical protein
MTTQPNSLENRFAADDGTSAHRKEFETVLERDRRAEWRLFWAELIALALFVEFALWALGLNYLVR